MITVISGTNRRDSECLRFAGIYAKTLQEHTNVTSRFNFLSLPFAR